MAHWQFLIQKKGDRAWQTLESPTLQISAGKYRVLARSHLPNTDVEVRVTHSSIQEVPPKRRIFKRLRRTNADGLMAVIPFTELKPGIWELRCSGDLMTDMLGKSWQYSLLIKVFPQETTEQPDLDNDDQFDKELDESAISLSPDLDINTLLTQTEEDIIINQPVSPVLFKGETAEQLLQSLIDLALPNPESSEEDPRLEDFQPVSSPSLIHLYLEQDNYIAPWGKTFILNGRAELAATENPEDPTISIVNLDQLQLFVELRSPLESKVLTQFSQPLPNKILPFTFATSINIPTECESKLILAEINLYGAVNNDREVKLLGTHAFTITANVTELLTVTLPKSHPPLLSESNQPPISAATQPEKPNKVSLELFNLVKTPKLAQFHILKPSTNKPLPPRIKPVIVLDGVSPELPKLPRISKNLIAESRISEVNIKTPGAIAPINLQKLVIKPIKTGFPFLKRLKSTPEPEQEAQTHLLNTPETQLDETENVLESLPSYENEDQFTGELITNTIPEFYTPNSEELITTETPATSPLIQKWMKNQGYLLPEGITLEYEEDDSEESTSTINAEEQSVEIELPLNLDVNLDGEIETETTNLEFLDLDTSEPTPEPENIPSWLSQEIVIDDIYMSLSNEENNQLLEEQQPELEDLSPPALNSLPTPQLFLPSGELLAGASIKVRLEMSEIASTVAIKLWVEDYQTRALLDGPHLIKDLRTTPWGNWEAITQLIVPLGCVEILVGAIALDLTSQQESHKVTTVKTVIPPNLPSMQIDELLDL
ncbi:hypothetical protein [Anabaena azotica]|uniref:hypothetical protein n=1 Tax=Anabaena azotica TaxID=197653 RepID=UPI0039A52FDC